MYTLFFNKIRKSEETPEMITDVDMFLKKAKKAVLIGYPSIDGVVGMDEGDLYIVWFSKTLENWKALVSTDVLKDTYFEVTYDGAKKHTYVDRYHKKGQVIVSDEQFKFHNN